MQLVSGNRHWWSVADNRYPSWRRSHIRSRGWR